MRALFLCTLLTAYMTQLNVGTITVVVRDARSQPVAGVQLVLWQDLDVDGRTEQATATTDAEGRASFPNLAFAVYAVEFRGSVAGLPIIPLAEQNRGPVDDGGSVAGFGMRLAAPELVRLFVVQAEGGSMVPRFDEVQDVGEAARPLVIPTPIMPSATAAVPSVAVPSGQQRQRWTGLLMPGVLALIGGSLLWLDARVRRREGGPHAD